MRYLIVLILLTVLACKSHHKYPPGGYAYPKSIADRDTLFYFYPLKNIETKKDSMQDVHAYLYYQAFDEPNMSIRAMDEESFRFIYSQPQRADDIIIDLRPDFLCVKKGSPSSLYYNDTSKLSPLENMHLTFLQRRYPVDTAGKKPWMKRYLDSMITLYPRLLDPAYYLALSNKIIVRNNRKSDYSLKKIHITSHQYDSLIRQINESGYWNLPYSVPFNVGDLPTDAGGFSLEANTKLKYNYVGSPHFMNDTMKFAKACQAIIDIAGLRNEIELTYKIEYPSKPIAIIDVQLEEIKEDKKK